MNLYIDLKVGRLHEKTFC